MKPVIGIIVCGLMDDRQFVTNAYIQSIKYAKGVPLLLPLVRSDEALQTYCSLCDGFLFCGGNDITPLLFGKEPAKGLGATNITLDIFQLRLLRAILKTKKPLLAICRGMQVLNVACGGTLLQDIDTSLHAPINHMQLSASRSEISHKVLVAKGSILSSITGSSLYTNSSIIRQSTHSAKGSSQLPGLLTASSRQSNFPLIHLPLESNGTRNVCTVLLLSCVICLLHLSLPAANNLFCQPLLLQFLVIAPTPAIWYDIQRHFKQQNKNRKEDFKLFFPGNHYNK